MTAEAKRKPVKSFANLLSDRFGILQKYENYRSFSGTAAAELATTPSLVVKVARLYQLIPPFLQSPLTPVLSPPDKFSRRTIDGFDSTPTGFIDLGQDLPA